MFSSSSEDDDVNLEAKREAKRLLRNRLITLYLKGPYTKQVNTYVWSIKDSIFIEELLKGPSVTCYELMRMEKNSFINLCKKFREKKWILDSKHVIVEEKMTMFLMTMSHNLQNRVVRNRFKHSTQTVHKCFHEVLAAMMKFFKEMITPPSFNGNCNGISNHRLRQIFKVNSLFL